MVKQILLLIAIGLGVFSCNKSDGRNEAELTYFRSYVNEYVEAPFQMTEGQRKGEKHLHLRYIWPLDPQENPCIIYKSPELGGAGSNAERFLEIAERNGDRSYNRKEWWVPGSTGRAFADNYRSIDIVSMNRAWDERHPAGSSLADLVTVECTSYAHYVRSGYRGAGPIGIEKKMNEIEPDELAMIEEGGFMLLIDTPPSASGTYAMHVTLTTTEGKEIIVTGDFTWDPTLIDPAKETFGKRGI